MLNDKIKKNQLKNKQKNRVNWVKLLNSWHESWDWDNHKKKKQIIINYKIYYLIN